MQLTQKDIDLNNLLGIYYDSRDSVNLNVPESIEQDCILVLMPNTGYGASGYNYLAHFINDTTNRPWASFQHYFKTLNDNFFIDNEQVKWTCNVTGPKKYYFEGNGYGHHDFTCQQVLQKMIENFDSVPKTVQVTIKVVRQPNEKARLVNAAKKRNGKSPEDWAKQMFSAELVSNGNSRSRSRWRSPFKGEFKQTIFAKDKREIIFLIEYLYGKKINIVSNRSDIARTLEGLGFSTFGIYDVKVLDKLVEVIQTGSITSMYKRLLELGIKPATSLSRWQDDKPVDNKQVT